LLEGGASWAPGLFIAIDIEPDTSPDDDPDI
jgi:hypothetical protein